MSGEGGPNLIGRILRASGRAAPFVVAAVLLLVTIGGGNALEYSSSPEFCATCHAMSSEYESWQASPHAPDTKCIECHSDAGVFGETIAHIKGVRYIYYALANVSVAGTTKVSNASCERCHWDEALADKVNGVQVNHLQHLELGTACLTCHSGLVHKVREFGEGDEQFHTACQTCHDREQVVLKATGSTSCTACHTDAEQVTPEDHKVGWLAVHGTAAGQGCGQCHLAEGAGPHAEMSRPAAFSSGSAGDACLACHQTPMPHPEPFLPVHGQKEAELGAATCARCHSQKTLADPGARHATARFCTSCHADVAMPHAEAYLARHGSEAIALGAAACAGCHSPQNQASPAASYASATFCTNCHGGLDMPHTQQFTAEHGAQAQKPGISCQACHSAANPVRPEAQHATGGFCADCHDGTRHQSGWVAAHGTNVNQSCATCHSEESEGRNACRDCHPGTPGDKSIAFHPDEYWFVKHAKVVVENGETACLKCHAEIQPSCAQCHVNR